MTTVKLINEDGVIKGVDPETGEQIPIEFGDIEANTVAAGPVKHTDFRGRPLWSSRNRTIKYGTDVTTPAELVGELPWFLFHDYEVDLSAVSDPDLDLRVPQIHSMAVGAQGFGREDEGLKLEGSKSGVGGPDIGSCYIDGFVGGTVQLKGVTLNKSNPFDDEGAAFVAKNTLRAAAMRCEIGSSLEPKENDYTVGFQSYASLLAIFECDIGENNVDFGLMAKKMGTIKEQFQRSVPLSGTANEYAYASGDGGMIWFTSENSEATGDSGLARANRAWAQDVDNNRLYGVREFMADAYEAYYDDLEMKFGGSQDSGPLAILRNNGDLDLAGTVNENAL